MNENVKYGIYIGIGLLIIAAIVMLIMNYIAAQKAADAAAAAAAAAAANSSPQPVHSPNFFKDPKISQSIDDFLNLIDITPSYLNGSVLYNANFPDEGVKYYSTLMNTTVGWDPTKKLSDDNNTAVCPVGAKHEKEIMTRTGYKRLVICKVDNYEPILGFNLIGPV
jgi:hypothetical protein